MYLFDDDNCVDYNGGTHRQRSSADGKAGVFTGITEDFDKEVRGTVNDGWMLAEIRHAIYKPTDLRNPAYAVQMATECGLCLRNDVETADTRGLNRIFNRIIVTNLADME